jgi:hypothetical protein
MVAGGSSETLVPIRRPTRRHFSQDHDLNTHSRDNFKSHMDGGWFPVELEIHNYYSKQKSDWSLSRACLILSVFCTVAEQTKSFSRI